MIDRQARDQRQRDLLSAQAAPGPGQVVQLVGPTGSAARAVLTPHPWGTSIDLTASGLDPGRTYSVWLEGRGGGRASAGAFQPDPSGGARLSLTTPAVLAESQTFGLTLVAAGAEPGQDVFASLLEVPSSARAQ